MLRYFKYLRSKNLAKKLAILAQIADIRKEKKHFCRKLAKNAETVNLNLTPWLGC
jgi:hypothetical protein